MPTRDEHVKNCQRRRQNAVKRLDSSDLEFESEGGNKVGLSVAQPIHYLCSCPSVCLAAMLGCDSTTGKTNPDSLALFHVCRSCPVIILQSAFEYES